MNSIAGWVGAMGVAVLATICPQKTWAEKFTGSEFLTWSVDGQDNYIGIAATMATMVAGRSNPATAACLDQWYAASEVIAAQRNVEIRATIARNAEYHPSAVILLVLEGACGSFDGK